MAIALLLVKVPCLSPPTPSPHLDLRTGSCADRCGRPRVQDILGALLVLFRIVTFIGDDQLYCRLGRTDLIQGPNEVRRVACRTSPELHRHDELLPRLRGHGPLQVTTSQNPLPGPSQPALSGLEYAGLARARGSGAEPFRTSGLCISSRLSYRDFRYSSILSNKSK